MCCHFQPTATNARIGDTYSVTFIAAGVYNYFCVYDVHVHMDGTVAVPLRVSPKSGVAGTLFTVTIATIPAPTDLVYDVQRQDPGGGRFVDWMTGVTATTVTFDSTDLAAGVYSFRSRVRRLSTDGATDYSPAGSVLVS
ncbi:MAG: hypothetical protein M3O94_06390 [Actinomycetota bacterium]|nr:hypothetical protein [Actinomycetota bacterium]